MAIVYLHGDLAQFGGPYRFNVPTPYAAASALCHQIKGFKRRLHEGSFRIVRRSAQKETELDERMLGISLNSDVELHITPVVRGSAKNGSTKAIMGIAIAAVAIVAAPAVVGAAGPTLGMGSAAFGIEGVFAVTYSQIAGFGAMMALGGIAQMLGGNTTSSASATEVATNASYVFNGPVNSTKQGVARPLVFGRFICSSVIISSDLVAERI